MVLGGGRFLISEASLYPPKEYGMNCEPEPISPMALLLLLIRRTLDSSARVLVLKKEFLIDNLVVRINLNIVMIRWTGLAPWELEFPSPGSLTSTFPGPGTNPARTSQHPGIKPAGLDNCHTGGTFFASFFWAFSRAAASAS